MYNKTSGEKIMRKVAIIGGGAAGVFCSICIKELLGDEVQVIILEKNERIGKKILSTGNGKCNLSNINIDDSYYNSRQVAYCLRKLPPNKLIEKFRSWGLYTKKDEEGRVYPYSEKATTVLDVFTKKIQEYDIKVKEFNVSHIKKTDHFLVYSKTYQLENVDYVVLATGSLACVSENNGYKIAESLGHTINPLRPGLVAIKTKENLKPLAGLRSKVLAKIIKNKKTLWSGKGEILFRDEGVSGILVFDLSRYLDNDTILSFDLVYSEDEESLKEFLNNDPKLLSGILPKMLASEIARRYEEDMSKDLIWYLKNFILHPSTTYGFSNAQITLGGININEVDPTSFASIKTDSLYMIGEILDIDGASGGYNLHFAWASAYLAALDIFKKIRGKIDEK